MTASRDTELFDFAISGRAPSTPDEHLLRELHATLGNAPVPPRVRHQHVSTRATRTRFAFLTTVAMLMVGVFVGAGIITIITTRETSRQHAQVPPVVLGLASPATATSSGTCDISRDIPLISGVEESPLPGKTILLTPAGDLVLACALQRDVLLTDIDLAYSTASPGVLFLQSDIDIVLYNLALRESYTFADPAFLATGQHASANILRGGKRLWIVPSSDNTLNAALLNLETFEETPLTDADGQPLRMDGIGAAAANYDEDALVLAYSRYRPELRSDYLQGYLFIMPDRSPAFLNVSSTNAPMPRELAVSPGGEHFAAVTYQSQGDTGAANVTISRMAALNPIWRADYEMPDTLTYALWMPSGEALVFTDGTRLYAVDKPYLDEEAATLLEAGQIRSITLTRDPNVVTIATITPGGQGTPPSPTTFIVNTTNGDVLALDGIDMFTPRMIHPAERNTLLLHTTKVPLEGRDNAAQVYDAATGDHLGEIEQPPVSGGGFASSQYGYGRAEIGIVSFGADHIWLLLGDNYRPILQHVAPPPGLSGTAPVSVTISEDGWLTLATTPGAPGWIIDLNAEDPQWVEIEFAPAAEFPSVDVVQGTD